MFRKQHAYLPDGPVGSSKLAGAERVAIGRHELQMRHRSED